MLVSVPEELFITKLPALAIYDTKPLVPLGLETVSIITDEGDTRESLTVTVPEDKVAFSVGNTSFIRSTVS